MVQPATVTTRSRGAGVRSSAYAVLSRRRVLFAIAILVALLFSKNVYTSSLGSYYTFYLIHKFGLSVQDAQIHLFVFLGAVAAGTFAGGPIGDRFGRKPVIWFSILGAFPFALMLPYASLFWTGILSVAIGLIMASAFSAILVYAQELLPGRVGMVAGHVLRLLVRPGRPRGGGAGPDRRLDQHRHGLPAVLVPAADRAADSVPAEYRTQTGLSRLPRAAGTATESLAWVGLLAVGAAVLADAGARRLGGVGHEDGQRHGDGQQGQQNQNPHLNPHEQLRDAIGRSGTTALPAALFPLACTLFTSHAQKTRW